MHPANKQPPVTKYYVRKSGLGLWYAFTYHPRKGESRPPKARKPFASARSLAKIMTKLAERISKTERNNITRQQRKARRMNIFDNLRAANATRQIEWDAGGVAHDPYWRANELAGESGEVCNVLKKLHRERSGVPGSRDTTSHLAEELADVVICVDLLLLSAGLPPVPTSIKAPEKLIGLSLVQLGTKLTIAVSSLCLPIDMPGDTEDDNIKAAASERIVQIATAIALREGIDLRWATMAKFNDTSRKMKLETMMGERKDASPKEPIPPATFYDAAENTFRDFNGKDMGVDFWGKWRGRNHEFPTHPPIRD